MCETGDDVCGGDCGWEPWNIQVAGVRRLQGCSVWKCDSYGAGVQLYVDDGRALYHEVARSPGVTDGVLLRRKVGWSGVRVVGTVLAGVFVGFILGILVVIIHERCK